MKSISSELMNPLCFLVQDIHRILDSRYPPEIVSRYIDKYLTNKYDFKDFNYFEDDLEASREENDFKRGYFIVSEYLRLVRKYDKPIPAKIPIEQAFQITRDLLYLQTLLLDFIKSDEAEEIGDFAEMFGKVCANTESSKKALDARHNPLREFKKQVAKVAQTKWESGSSLLHHQLTKFLIEEYQDETGKYPFMYLPIKDRNGNLLPSEKVIRETLKQVAKTMNRPDLISGQKKKP